MAPASPAAGALFLGAVPPVVAAGGSVMTAVTCRGLRSRISATSSLSPTRERPMALRSSLLDLMDWPLMLVMTSPGLMPALSAAEPSVDLRDQHALGGGDVQRLGHVGRQRIDAHA